MRHTDICGLLGYTIFYPHYLINGTIFEKKITDHKMRFFLYDFRLKDFSLQEEISDM